MDLEQLEIEAVREDDEIILMDSAGTPLARIAHADDPAAIAFADRLEACWRFARGLPIEELWEGVRLVESIGTVDGEGDHAAP